MMDLKPLILIFDKIDEADCFRDNLYKYVIKGFISKLLKLPNNEYLFSFSNEEILQQRINPYYHNQFRVVKEKNVYDSTRIVIYLATSIIKDDDAKILAAHLYEIDSVSFMERYNKLDELINKSKERSISCKEKALVRTADTFNKIEQGEICKTIINAIIYKHMKNLKEDFLKLFNEKLYVIHPELSEHNGMITKLALQKVRGKVDRTGEELYKYLKDSNLDVEKLLTSWLNSSSETLRRFALKFTNNKVLGLVDESDRIRRFAKKAIESSSDSKNIV